MVRKPEVKFGNVAAKKIVIYPSVHSKGSYISHQHEAGATTPQEFTPWVRLSLFLWWRIAGVCPIASPASAS